jgi:hypothetical protein
MNPSLNLDIQYCSEGGSSPAAKDNYDLPKLGSHGEYPPSSTNVFSFGICIPRIVVPRTEVLLQS